MSLPGSSQVAILGCALPWVVLEFSVVMSSSSPVFRISVHAEIMGGSSSFGSAGTGWVILAEFSPMTFCVSGVGTWILSADRVSSATCE